MVWCFASSPYVPSVAALTTLISVLSFAYVSWNNNSLARPSSRHWRVQPACARMPCCISEPMLIAFYRGEMPHPPADRTFQFQILRRETHGTVRNVRVEKFIKQKMLISLRERLNQCLLSSLTGIKRIKHLRIRTNFGQQWSTGRSRTISLVPRERHDKWMVSVQWKATQLREVGEFLLARKCIDMHLRKQWPITLRYGHQRH